MTTETIVREVVDLTLARTWSLIAFNDDVTPFDLVILGLLTIGLSEKDAVLKTIQIHKEGSAVVKSGMSKDEATRAYNIVKEITKGGGRFPGIDMSLVEDM